MLGDWKLVRLFSGMTFGIILMFILLILFPVVFSVILYFIMFVLFPIVFIKDFYDQKTKNKTGN